MLLRQTLFEIAAQAQLHSPAGCIDRLLVGMRLPAFQITWAGLPATWRKRLWRRGVTKTCLYCILRCNAALIARTAHVSCDNKTILFRLNNPHGLSKVNLRCKSEFDPEASAARGELCLCVMLSTSSHTSAANPTSSIPLKLTSLWLPQLHGALQPQRWRSRGSPTLDN